MAFIDEISGKARGLQNLARLNSLINTEEKNLTSLYTQYGQICYETITTKPEPESVDEMLARLNEVTSLICKGIFECRGRLEVYKQETIKIRNVRICPGCGAECSYDKLFCAGCGMKLPDIAPAPAQQAFGAPGQPQQEAVVFCTNCGAKLAAGTVFCVNCGTKL